MRASLEEEAAAIMAEIARLGAGSGAGGVSCRICKGMTCDN